MSDGSTQSFNLDAFNEEVTAQAADIQLKGPLRSSHGVASTPGQRRRCRYVAVAWSQRWAADAEAVGKTMGAAEQRMKQQGGVPTAHSGSDGTIGGVPTAAPVKSGASVSTSNF